MTEQTRQYENEDGHKMVNLSQLAAHLDQLYDQVSALRWRVTKLERQQRGRYE